MVYYCAMTAIIFTLFTFYIYYTTHYLLTLTLTTPWIYHYHQPTHVLIG